MRPYIWFHLRSPSEAVKLGIDAPPAAEWRIYPFQEDVKPETNGCRCHMIHFLAGADGGGDGGVDAAF